MFFGHVDKTTIKSGESITLTLEYRGQPKGEPDFSPLEKDFTILSRQTSQESSFVNGNHQAKTSWILEILPKSSAKNLTVPAIKLGSDETRAIAIAQSDIPAAGSDDIALSVSADRSDVYVNAELILNVVIKTSLALRNGTLSKLEIKDAIVESLIEDDRNEVVENGIKYQVFTQRLAVYPSKAGTLTIPSVTFKGVTSSGSNRGGFPGMGGFFSGGSQVASRSLPFTVAVKEVPKEYPADQQFLPLKSFVVIESFDDANPLFEINKAISRRYEMKAKGTLASFLPTINTPNVTGLQVYAETGNKIQANVGDGMEASAKFSHIYMPTTSGKIIVPEKTIYWWDTETDKLKTTVIRSLEIDVVGGGANASAPKGHDAGEAAENIVENQTTKPDLIDSPASTTSQSNLFWPLVALGFFVLWLVTLAIYFFARKSGKDTHAKEKEISPKQILAQHVNAVKQACDAHDGKAAYRRARTLLAWVDKLNDEVVHQQTLISLVSKLEAALYDKSNQASVNDVLVELKNCAANMSIQPKQAPLLAPLYPQ